MKLPFPVERVVEGAAKLWVPAVERPRGPGTRTRLPFYNPTMRVSRDVTAMLAVLSATGREVLDGLAATGATGIRIALEAGRPFSIHLNDWSEGAAALLRENAAENGLDAIRVSRDDVHRVFREATYDWVDVDPYGTPVPFLDGAVRCVRDGGIASVTATDTGVLCGPHRKACRRRYGATTAPMPFAHEAGLRILLGTLVRTAARFDRAAEPLVAFSSEHFLRAICRIRSGAGRADESLAQVQTVRVDELEAGPLWTGPLGDPSLLADLRPTEHTGHPAVRLALALRAESGFPPFGHALEGTARRLRVDEPRIDVVLERLAGQGVPAARSHTDPKLIKTAASREEFESAVLAATAPARP